MFDTISTINIIKLTYILFLVKFSVNIFSIIEENITYNTPLNLSSELPPYCITYIKIYKRNVNIIYIENTLLSFILLTGLSIIVNVCANCIYHIIEPIIHIIFPDINEYIKYLFPLIDLIGPGPINNLPTPKILEIKLLLQNDFNTIGIQDANVL